MFADLAVLSDDPLTVEESKLREITSLMTMVSGHDVYQAEANRQSFRSNGRIQSG